MKNLRFLFCLLIFILFTVTRCNEEKSEKFQKHRNNFVNVEDKIIDIKIDKSFSFPMLYIFDDILFVSDLRPHGNKFLHLFNKNTFESITSTGILGRGPGEIVNPGNLGIDEKNRIFWVADHGKKLRWKFYLDSILSNDMYKPTESLEINYDLFIERYGFLNDSIVLGKAVHILPDRSFVKSMAKLNMNTNKIELYGYEHPKAAGKKSSSDFKLSVENKFYVNAYYDCDLMTICDLDGRLKYNIYGPGWLKNKDNKNNYFFQVDIMDNYIIASYLNDVGIYYDDNQRQRGNLPSKFLVFDSDGDYIETINTGFKINTFCVDEENKRVIVYFEDRDPPLGYFNFNLD